jgi:hypothetical protein
MIAIRSQSQIFVDLARIRGVACVRVQGRQLAIANLCSWRFFVWHQPGGADEDIHNGLAKSRIWRHARFCS